MKKLNRSVCLADIAGFMKKMASESEEKVIKELQEFYKKAGDIIFKNNGKIIKYIGDAILFTFKKPSEAKAAAEKITKLRIKGCKIRVSIATGPVYELKSGHPKQKINDIFGRTVNLAATMLGRIEKDKKAEYLILCNETKRLLSK